MKFTQRDGNLKISVQEYPTVNKISFEGNAKFTDEKLEPLLTIKPRLVFTPKSLERDLAKSRSRDLGVKTNLGLIVKRGSSFSSVNFALPSKDILLTVGYSCTEIFKFPSRWVNFTELNNSEL